jgi:hypothetical protein
MLKSRTVQQIATTSPDVYAFRLRGEVMADDLRAMAETMNAAFDVQPAVSMLLIFDAYEGVETGAGFDVQTLTSQFRSLVKVDKYAVVGAPGFASGMINVMDKIIPTDARTFDAGDEAMAWDFVGARPAD